MRLSFFQTIRTTLPLLLFTLGTTFLGLRASGEETKKLIVLIAGKPSHGYGSHEHYAGCRLLADTIQKSVPGVQCEIVRNGWPEADSILDRADSIVIYSDGGNGHPANQHLDRLGPLMDKGVGFVCLHYGVEVPKGNIGDKFLDWLGGYFETHWSVNPHWTANYAFLPSHPITRGVSPFEANDEWYFHMRFREGMKGITPILSAVPPPSTMERPDGPHSGNPDVRRAVQKKEPQHTAWAYDRPNGGRSFGFTGGHYHWNWGQPDQLRLVSNAILWTAKVELPEKGVAAPKLSLQRLQENQDESVPDKFVPKSIIDTYHLEDAKGEKPAAQRNPSSSEGAARRLYASPLMRGKTRKVQATANIRGVKKLVLVVRDGGDGFSCDWADWLNPTLVGPNKKQLLTELKWTSATTQWGEVQKNRNVSGGPMQVDGESFASGIGTHANSEITFDIPEGFEEFQFACGLDAGGTSQNDGNTTSVEFFVYAEAAEKSLRTPGGDDQRSPEKAVEGLTVHPGVEATLAASEPTLQSLTNLDIDDRGRVWVCEVVNYRKHNGERAEGDRILILEDTNQDGVMDKSKVFYQGREIDSAMGIVVLGNQVLVSAAPYVWRFTDADGDDVPEKKEAILTKTGQPQHDHSNHSFVFGPDGKLYWNFGNTGKAMHDAAGNPVLDRWGRPINDSGKPYRQGMAFRCNLDLSDMEVLGHNFRNNYELAVDSFGSVWQSDNDDDGNRATRINYVMEFGNFGYTDEMTGEGWQAERIGWEATIPERHWHLNDPGVSPSVLITGAGSPTGILVYEGRLLPKPFWDQVIHCDAGPNVVRAYPTKPMGAGYSAEILDLVVGDKDKWFRPADACVAPDGSLYVTDWYDPGVGGHNMVDMERGRLFRMAPPNTKYVIPKFDYSTPEGAVEALKNPSHSVRTKAWMALHAMGAKAKSALEKLFADSNPRLRARALWLLGKIPEEGKRYVLLGLLDKDPDIRVTSIRLARQSKFPTSEYAPKMIPDSSPFVIRELAIALREDTSANMPEVWAGLARRYDGKDRWYLEALGIGAMDRWPECIAAWLKIQPNAWNTEAGKQIVWRARCPQASELLAKLITDPSTPEGELDKLMRGLDFQNPEEKKKGLEWIVNSTNVGGGPRRDRLVVEASMRLGNDVNQSPELKESVDRYLTSLGDQPAQLRVMRQLKLKNKVPRLLDLIGKWGPGNDAVQAIDLALSQGGRDAMRSLLSEEVPTELAKAVSKTLALSNHKEATSLLEEVLVSDKIDSQFKIDAALGLARNPPGQKKLIAMAKEGKLPGEAKVLIGPTLMSSRDEGIRQDAAKLFPSKKTSQAVLPSVTELASRKGDASKGQTLFSGVATCSQCHIVSNQGKNVGPDLTEIGTKLSREAMYVSILEPSAGISHNFEAYNALTTDGEVISGLLVSQSGDNVTLRDAKGIERPLKKSELESFKKSEKSLMPDNLQETMTEAGLVDLVEYLMSLRKK